MDLFNSLPLKKQEYMNRLFRNCTEEVKYYMSVIDVEADQTFIKAVLHPEADGTRSRVREMIILLFKKEQVKEPRLSIKKTAIGIKRIIEEMKDVLNILFQSLCILLHFKKMNL